VRIQTTNALFYYVLRSLKHIEIAYLRLFGNAKKRLKFPNKGARFGFVQSVLALSWIINIIWTNIIAEGNMSDSTLVQLFNDGGALMWPLLVCSILAIAVIIDRAIFYLRISRNYGRFVITLVPFVANRRTQAAKDYLRGRNDPSSLVAVSYLGNLDLSPNLRNQIIQRIGSEQVERVEKRLGILSTIAHLSPLLGLFGTVLGMIEAFRRVAELHGQAQVSEIAGGIWEALITTAFGLAVAIPTAAAYHYFEALATKHRNRMANITSVLDETLKIDSAGVEITETREPEGDADNVGF